jgi:hypothetical protein
MRRDREVHQFPPTVRDDEEDVQRLKGEGLDGQQIGGPDAVRVVP